MAKRLSSHCALALFAILAITMFAACGGQTQPAAENQTQPAEGQDQMTGKPENEASASAAGTGSAFIDGLLAEGAWTDFEGGIKYLDVTPGTGAEVKVGDTITAYYTLWLDDGTMLQSNKGQEPFSVPVGVGNLIKGWDLTVPGMKEGGVRKLIVPGDYAYGEAPPPNSGIKPNATLVFELEIVKTVSR